MVGSGLAQFINNNNNNNNILKKQKKSKQIQKIYDFLVCFSTNLHDIRLHIYIVKYKSDIKILGFL
jgi:hypothetical protein